MATQTLFFLGKPLGTNEPGKPFRSDLGSWRRIDRWTNANTRELFVEERAAAGPDDQSPIFSASYAGDPGNGRYNSECPCCWLGHSHTLAYHNKLAVIPDPFRG